MRTKRNHGETMGTDLVVFLCGLRTGGRPGGFLDRSGSGIYNTEKIRRSEVFYVKRGEITIA